MRRCSGFASPKIAARDLGVAVIGQLSAANLPLSDEFEPGTMKVIAFEAAFRRRGLINRRLEDAPGNPNHPLIVAHPDSELDGVSFRAPPSVRWEAEEHGRSYNVLPNIPQMHWGVECWILPFGQWHQNWKPLEGGLRSFTRTRPGGEVAPSPDLPILASARVVRPFPATTLAVEIGDSYNRSDVISGIRCAPLRRCRKTVVPWPTAHCHRSDELL
jgi:hypothetical protein